MGRAAGKHKGRPGELSPEQKAEFGIDDRDIPGGATHLVNPVTVTRKVPAAKPLGEFRGMMAHGVPPEGQYYERTPKGKPYQPHYTPLAKPPSPVPVYIVEAAAGGTPFKHIFVNRITVPSGVIEPVRLCSIDPGRDHVRLLNETAAAAGVAGVRFGPMQAVEAGTGALLPSGMTNYLAIEGQDELFAVPNDANTYVISVILESSTPGTA
jgi:hypothetical protein